MAANLDPDLGGIAVRLRDPGQAWGSPTTIPAPFVERVLARVSDRGDALVAWVEDGNDGNVSRIWVARRAAAGAFGPPQEIGRARYLEALRIGMSDSGEAVVLWTSYERGTLMGTERARAAIAPAGGDFGAPADLGPVNLGSTPALAVAGDGGALAVVPDIGSVKVFERQPGATSFGAPVQIARPGRMSIVSSAAALTPTGGAVVAWHSFISGGTGAVTREGPGAFGAPVLLQRDVSLGPDPFWGSPWLIALTTSRASELSGDLGAAVGPNGRAVVAWTSFNRGPGAAEEVVHAAALPLAGGPASQSVVPAPYFQPDEVMPLVLGDGAVAAVWGDRDALHAAVEGGTKPPATAVPRVHVGGPAKSVLGPRTSLTLPISCTAACEVKARVKGVAPGSNPVILRHAGAGKLVIQPGSGPIAPRKLGPVHVWLTYGKPGSITTRTRTVTLRLRRGKTTPTPLVTHLRAVRHGDRIRVTWRLNHPTTKASSTYMVFWVTGTATASAVADVLALNETEAHLRKQDFSLTLKAGPRVKYVTVRSENVGYGIVRRMVVAVV